MGTINAKHQPKRSSLNFNLIIEKTQKKRNDLPRNFETVLITWIYLLIYAVLALHVD